MTMPPPVDVETLIAAYAVGLFPMAVARNAAGFDWYDPEVRSVLPVQAFHVPRRLHRTLRAGAYAVTFDRDFPGVMRACAAARPSTWINDDILALYAAAFDRGIGHSVEVWREGRNVGGLYGLALGGVFFGESMFSAERDASKIALVHLLARLSRQGYTLLDAQFPNAHLRQFGFLEVPRADYRRRLAAALAQPAVFGDGQSSVSAGVSSDGAAGAGGAAGAEGFLDVVSFLQSISQTS